MSQNKDQGLASSASLIELLSDDERVVSIEDTLELRIERSNCVRLEARGLGTGAVTIRDLVRHALRHRPDHIVVGEVRGGLAGALPRTGHCPPRSIDFRRMKFRGTAGDKSKRDCKAAEPKFGFRK